jgi:CRISPR-associated protein Cas5, Ecoli subtype
MTEANTLFLRLEGPLQAWGDTSKFVIRRTMDAPTKSGVLGLLCCAMGLPRQAARERLSELNRLAMGVRIDRPGTRWWDYHTVGAGIGIITADGKGIKRTPSTGEIETLITRREYLADASFLVALQGDAKLIHDIAAAIASPKWPVFLGRKSCPPSVPVLARPSEGELWTNPAGYDGLNAALGAMPWHPRYKTDVAPKNRAVETLVEWRSAPDCDVAPDDAEVWYDVPVCFDPPVHEARFVLRGTVPVEVGDPIQTSTPAPPRPRADYKNTEYRKRREERIKADTGLCVFCKSPGPRMTVQHVTYRRAGGNETLEDLRSLCGLCHDAVTMLEYGLGMELDRINPEEPRWRDRIIQKRAEILKYRSLETRRRRLVSEEVE